MSDVVAVEYELTREDWISAVMSYSRRSELVSRSLRATRFAFGLIFAALVLMVLWGGSLGTATVLAVLGAIWIAAMPSMARRNQRRHLRKIAAEGVANGTFGRHRVVLTDEGILDSAEGYDSLVHWSAVEQVVDSGGALLIYNGANSFTAIPVRAFPDRATFEAFSRRFFRGLERAGSLGTLAAGEDALED